MRQGRIVQQGSPRELYDAPSGAWVADFVGKSNFLAGTVAAVTEAGVDVSVAGRMFHGRRLKAGLPLRPGERAVLTVRPELVRLGPPGVGTVPSGRVLNRIFLGEHTEYLVRTAALGDLLALVPRAAEADSAARAPGDEVGLSWPETAALALADDREPQ
jgi:spermidine/putrescine transport system ATP-binding protein